jgi:YD repeat-containing protein
VSYTYNADGSKATQTDGTGTSTFSYDSAGRLIGTTNGAGATTTWGYNTLGQLICQSYDNPAGNTCRGSGAGTSSARSESACRPVRESYHSSVKEYR